MRVIVTRPAREAGPWVRDLADLGLDAQALPLIDVAPVPDTAAMDAAWQRLPRYRALMFVSGNAARYFFQENRAAARIQSGDAAIETRAWAPGPGTAAVLREAGVEPARIDGPADDAPQFDSQTLWERVCGQVRAGDRVLIVRGADSDGQGAGRDWLARQVAAAGGVVDTVEAYVRRLPQLNAAQLALARTAAGDGSVWLFSSSQAIVHLALLLPGQDWAGARAVATHPRIAQAARDAGFGVVCESRPAADAIAAALESIR